MLAGRAFVGVETRGMSTPIDVARSRSFSGTPRRIYQLIADLGTSADIVWPFAAQPFMRTSGPLVVGTTEEWHLGMHAVLAEVVPERKIVWKIDNDGFDGTHSFALDVHGKQVTLEHRLTAELTEDGRQAWRRMQEMHERAIDGLFDKLAKVLRR